MHLMSDYFQRIKDKGYGILMMYWPILVGKTTLLKMIIEIIFP